MRKTARQQGPRQVPSPEASWGGPVGAAVGAGVGAVAGGIADDTRPRFRSYVSEHHVPSYRYEREVCVGADLPSNGITYYEVPREYGVTKYRYTVVNDRTGR